ncbi:HupE/UreJ protein [Roseimicrobium gellanilyticum]|uniref:HupE/UreJ protein n=1 Tax=Roseimicrobium gellanilyticum TaxID=748857 RepID=A0A366HMF5_9BACT|nr:HupE/UreJ family protein [Roseimicrobium gellanilyticum]RBP44319.1 HupE/UreJ protein [Roseimicrobium gellanilyticum]
MSLSLALLQPSLSVLMGGLLLPFLLAWQEEGMGGVAAHFLSEGFVHIIPEGLDHILFVLGLFFMCRAFPALLLQITLFTMAHSVTFGLGMLGLVKVPGNVVEPLIALSIAMVAVENILLPKPERWKWRLAAVFVFGLVHGLGFANAFQKVEVSLSPATFPIALLSLNLGVGLGHLAVVGVAYLACSAFWNREWYRKAVAVPASGVIAVVSVCWVVARVMG